MVFLSSRISPFASTTIFCCRSPARWPSRPGRCCAPDRSGCWPSSSRRRSAGARCPRRRARRPDRRACPRCRPRVARRMTWSANELELIDHDVDGVLELEDLALARRPRSCGSDRPRATAVVTSAMSRTWLVRLLAIRLTLSVSSFHVPRTPSTIGLTAEPALDADLARHARHLRGERVQLIDHRVQRFLELQHLAARVDRDLPRQIAAATARATSAMLRTWLVRLLAIEFTLSRELLPDAGDVAHLGLPAEHAFGADLARHARHLGRERRRASRPSR